MKEKQTKGGLRLLITFIKIDSVETALAKIEKSSSKPVLTKTNIKGILIF